MLHLRLHRRDRIAIVRVGRIAASAGFAVAGIGYLIDLLSRLGT